MEKKKLGPSDTISEPCEASVAYRCPCCDFKTLHGRGAFEICPVCYWEDDGQDQHNADLVRGGPNGVLSLTEAQKNFREFGASDPKFTTDVRKPFHEEL